MTAIGDLGCLGVDVEEWRRMNRVPVFPGKINRWILVRTLRDDPTPADLRTTLSAVFVKWFEGTLLDPALTFQDTTRSGTADLIKLERATRERLSFTNTARRREELPGALPTLRSGPYVWLEVTFAYRGQQTDIPWPVRTGAVVQLDSSAQCPADADWILDSAAVATEPAPVEKSTTEKVAEKGKDAANKLMSGLWVPIAIAGGALVLFALLGRR